MLAKVTQQQFEEIVKGTHILSDEEMAEDFRQFLSNSGIEIRERNHPLTNFDYVFYTRDLKILAFSINLKDGGETTIEMIKKLFKL
jgi:hypothetical protein